jgi:hypothetical protein
MDGYTKKQLISKLSKENNKSPSYYNKWKREKLIKKLSRSSRIVCNKLIGGCGVVNWDGKGKKPPFWDNNYETMEECKIKCHSILDIIPDVLKNNNFHDNEMARLNRVAKNIKNSSSYSNTYVISNINPKEYSKIRKLVIETTDDYILYIKNFNLFENVTDLLIGKKVDGNIIDTTMTPVRLLSFKLESDNFNKPIILKSPLRKFKFCNFIMESPNNITFDLPTSLRTLFIDSFLYDKPIKHKYLEKLVFRFGNKFNQTITQDNLPNLKIFFIGWECSWNQPIDNLPRELIHLHLGGNGDFNRPVKNIPETLKTMYLIGEFDHNVNKHNLPKNLETLCLGLNFDKPLDDLPDRLQNLLLYCESGKVIENLPTDLNFLFLHFEPDHSSKLPTNLPNLFLGRSAFGTPKYVRLPPNLETLTFECNLSFREDEYTEVDLYNIPKSLKVLNMGTSYPSSAFSNTDFPNLSSVTCVKFEGMDNDYMNKFYMELLISGVSVTYHKHCREYIDNVQSSMGIVNPLFEHGSLDEYYVKLNID